MPQPLHSPPEILPHIEASSFSRLFADFTPRIQGYLRRLTGNAAEAEDLTQDVFLAAYAGRHSYSGNAPPLGWLMGIARRRWRDNNRGVRLRQVEMPEETGSADPVGAQVVRAAHLEDCLSQIDPAARQAVLLVFGEGLTYAEAAEVLKEPVGTVKWRVHVATKTLRILLRADETEEP